MFRKGDKVSITGTVVYNQESGQVFVECGRLSNTVICDAEEVVIVRPLLGVGDYVQSPNGRIWLVVAADGEKIWARGPMADQIFSINDLTRYEMKPEEDPLGTVALDVPANT